VAADQILAHHQKENVTCMSVTILRILTKKEREYLEKLAQRNIQLPREAKSELWFQGLSVPMAPGERQIRRRIRKKAITALFDLDLVGSAGVLPSRKIRKQGARSVVGMLDQIGFAMILRRMDSTYKAEARAIEPVCKEA
jgi:hypothetical protein